jgi:hypothetical protein
VPRPGAIPVGQTVQLPSAKEKGFPRFLAVVAVMPLHQNKDATLMSFVAR